MSSKTVVTAVHKDHSTVENGVTIHHLAESTLTNPVLLAQYAINAQIIGAMAWLTWGLKWTRGIVKAVGENLTFDFVGESAAFLAYMATYANPFDVGAYEPKRTADNRPQSPTTAKTATTAKLSKRDDLSAWLVDEYGLNDAGLYAVLAALTATHLSGYGAMIDYAIETYANKHGKESLSMRKANNGAIRSALKNEYANRKAYIEYVNGKTTDDSPSESAVVPTVQAVATNATDLTVMIANMQAQMNAIIALATKPSA